MRLLLDTHAALWAITNNPRLPARIRALIEDPANEIIVSAVSIWEIGVKNALRRLGSNPLPFSAHESLGLFRRAGYELLPVTPEHGAAVETLPLHHGDPFDRLLVAQAMTEPLRLVSHHPMIGRTARGSCGASTCTSWVPKMPAASKPYWLSLSMGWLAARVSLLMPWTPSRERTLVVAPSPGFWSP